MPRGPRLDAPGILQHVIARGIEKGKIFIDSEDYYLFIDRLGKVATETGTSIIAWCLLSNHFHFLLKTNNQPLSLFMKRLLTGHAITFNRRHKRSGHLFQNRYKSIACQEDAYLLQLIRYIHLNPLKAGIVKSITELNNYPYSSHQLLIGKKRLTWQKGENTLAHFGKNKALARKKYQKFLAEEITSTTDFEGGGLLRSIGGLKNLGKEKIAYDERILGDSVFVEELLQVESLKEKIKPKPQTTVDQLIEEVINYFEITPFALKGSIRTKKATDARAVIFFLAIEYLGLKGSEIASKLNVTKACVSRLLPRGREVVENNGLNKMVTY